MTTQSSTSAVVIGASGGIGGALEAALIDEGHFGNVHGLARSRTGARHLDLLDESTIAAAAAYVAKGPPPGLVVVATGLYLYIFFKTGVQEAYDSVDYLTHNQWWLGGIARSLHRYASDAMVLTMALHLVRHFVFDHYRSFRWFSCSTAAG